MAAKNVPKRRRQGKKNILSSVIESRFAPVIFLTALILGSSSYGLWYFLMKSHYFIVRDVSVTKGADVELKTSENKLKSRYVGVNIFRVDLKEAAGIIGKDMPELKKVEVVRRLPDKLEIDITKRIPMALVDAGKMLLVDKDGIVLGPAVDRKDFILIQGVNFVVRNASAGEKISDGSMHKALRLIEMLNERNFVKRYSVKRVDISDKNNILLGVRNISVKMGSEDFIWKIKKLGEILDDPKVNVDELAYIDLRFDEVVLSPKRQ